MALVQAFLMIFFGGCETVVDIDGYYYSNSPLPFSSILTLPPPPPQPPFGGVGYEFFKSLTPPEERE